MYVSDSVYATCIHVCACTFDGVYAQLGDEVPKRWQPAKNLWSGKHLPPPGVPLHAHWHNIAKWAANIDQLLFQFNIKTYSSDIVW